MRFPLALSIALAAAFPALAEAHETIRSGADVKWGAAPPNVPKGAQVAILAGDPEADDPTGK